MYRSRALGRQYASVYQPVLSLSPTVYQMRLVVYVISGTTSRIRPQVKLARGISLCQF